MLIVIISYLTMGIYEESSFMAGKIILFISAVILHTFSSFISMVYSIYVEYTTFRKQRNSRYWLLYFSIPTFLVLSLSICSFYTGWFFFITRHNIYMPGPFHYIPIIVPLWYHVFAVFILIVRKKQYSNREFVRLIMFPIPILIGGTFQAVFQNYSLFLPSYILSLFVLYSCIQERRLSYDHLTGAFNRQRLENYLDAMISITKNTDIQFAALMADVNSFKKINDTYGHTEGDRALITVVDTLRKNIRKNDFIARYAGDEFVVIFPKCSEKVLDEIISRIINGFKRLPLIQTSFSISLSIGYSMFIPEKDLSQNDFIVRLDKLMYINKKAFYE